jgi:hypothetical protein
MKCGVCAQGARTVYEQLSMGRFQARDLRKRCLEG